MEIFVDPDALDAAATGVARVAAALSAINGAALFTPLITAMDGGRTADKAQIYAGVSQTWVDAVATDVSSLRKSLTKAATNFVQSDAQSAVR